MVEQIKKIILSDVFKRLIGVVGGLPWAALLFIVGLIYLPIVCLLNVSYLFGNWVLYGDSGDGKWFGWMKIYHWWCLVNCWFTFHDFPGWYDSDNNPYECLICGLRKNGADEWDRKKEEKEQQRERIKNSKIHKSYRLKAFRRRLSRRRRYR